jgi:ParB family chromosome partitioning protein
MGNKADKKPALGRGLDALLGGTGISSTSGSAGAAGWAGQTPANSLVVKATPQAAIPKVGEVAHLTINEIEANPDQPRRVFAEEALAELADSIKTLGIIQPLTVRRMSVNRYQLISGERRFRAAQVAGLDRVPSYIREVNDQEMLEMALVENIQREDLNALEVAITYDRLMTECGLTHEQMAQRLGKGRATVSNYVRLLGLPAEMKRAISEGSLSFGHARILVGIDDDALRAALFAQIGTDSLSVRAAERWVKDLSAPVPKSAADADLAGTSTAGSVNLQAAIQRAQLEFRQRFDAQVKVSTGRSGQGGTIKIPFESAADLDALLDALNKRQY